MADNLLPVSSLAEQVARFKQKSPFKRAQKAHSRRGGSNEYPQSMFPAEI